MTKQKGGRNRKLPAGVVFSGDLVILFDKSKDVSRRGDWYIFCDIVVEPRSVVCDNILICISEHQPFPMPLFEGSHALEIKIVLPHSMHHQFCIVAKIFWIGLYLGRHKHIISPNTNCH